MISLESGKKYGKFCLYIRTWDGYDKPQYYPVMDITKDEIDFKGGRFERCLGSAKPGLGTGYNLYLKIINPKDELEDLVNFVAENTYKQWALDIEETFCIDCWRFSFTNEGDAVLCKLQWDAKSSISNIIDDFLATEVN